MPSQDKISEMEMESFNALIEKSIVNNWDRDALTDFKGATLQYHDVARKIEKLHIMFENSGVKEGDKIALCGRNSACWAVAFLATLTYGAVAVPILHEFTAEQIHNIVNHSDAKLLFVGDVVATVIDATKMPGLEGIVYIPDYSLGSYQLHKWHYRFLKGCDDSLPCVVEQLRLCHECDWQEG